MNFTFNFIMEDDVRENLKTSLGLHIYYAIQREKAGPD